ncbi:helix-turn-helix transcriptional regulator [Streptomyces sp. NPDC058625]|uniref:helix-turn-helix transcriptional regulator n=1 Tax=Streptomyces sp. NPDC058625 TaxID=3346564 RepID=UPI003652CB91
MSTTRPLLTQREAATACGVSRTTIRRRREAGELPGAVLDDDRGWLIPRRRPPRRRLPPQRPRPT